MLGLYLMLPMIGAVLLISVAIATLAVVVATFVALFGFGWEVACANIAIEATAETIAPGDYHGQFMLVPHDELQASPDVSRHGVHQMPSIRKRLVRWILTCHAEAS